MTKGKGGASNRVMETYQTLIGNRLTATTTAQPLIARPNTEGFTCIVQASHDNTGTVLVGNANVQTFELEAGEAVSIPASPESVYVRADSGTQVVNWLGGA